MEWSTTVENPVLHVVVVGFHHKKGCQVEYSYPPLISGNTVDSNECPDVWKHLPSLALPDGAHNFTEDTVYFHLPSRTEPKSTVFGVSCYRQIDSTELLNRGTDVTRNTVQKSVCVLSRLPVFGLIQAKLQLITHAYFKGRDFSQVALLEETYKTLNMSLTDSLLRDSQVFLGLSCRELLLQFQHKILILFKLLLLERRVLFFSSPVKPICTSLLTVVSLFPGMIEHGLQEAASYSTKRKTSSTLEVVECDDYLKVQYQEDNESDTLSSSLRSQRNSSKRLLSGANSLSLSHEAQVTDDGMNYQENRSQSTFYVNMMSDGVGQMLSDDGEKLTAASDSDLTNLNLTGDRTTKIFGSCPRATARIPKKSDKPVSDIIKDPDSSNESFPSAECNLEDLLDKDDELTWETNKLLLEISEALDDETYISPAGFIADSSDLAVHTTPNDVQLTTSAAGQWEPSDQRTGSVDSLADNKSSKDQVEDNRSALEFQNNNSVEQTTCLNDSQPSLTASTAVVNLVVDEFGFPLSIFNKGMLCHPYLSLHLYDILNDVNVRGFVIGATNALFRQKAHLTDVVVELSELKIDIHDHELKKQLTLTTADLRFAEHLVRSIGSDKGDIFLDNTEWEGGDDWLRSQFKSYLLSLLATVSHGDEKMIEDFNSSFAMAWKTTHNYKQWKSRHHPGMAQVIAEHPFHGQLSIADVRMKINQVIQQADRNKKINAVVSQTGKVVSQTGKVVGDAFNSAKSAMTTWFVGIGGSKS